MTNRGVTIIGNEELANLLESDCFIRTAFAKQGSEIIYTFTATIQSDRMIEMLSRLKCQLDEYGYEIIGF